MKIYFIGIFLYLLQFPQYVLAQKEHRGVPFELHYVNVDGRGGKSIQKLTYFSYQDFLSDQRVKKMEAEELTALVKMHFQQQKNASKSQSDLNTGDRLRKSDLLDGMGDASDRQVEDELRSEMRTAEAALGRRKLEVLGELHKRRLKAFGGKKGKQFEFNGFFLKPEGALLYLRFHAEKGCMRLIVRDKHKMTPYYFVDPEFDGWMNQTIDFSDFERGNYLLEIRIGKKVYQRELRVK
ncbi:MAG: hypothetical protein MI784_00615 [Cytophagales bacterium]|nr:hypothetical protein [Cytophagales bacterium]